MAWVPLRVRLGHPASARGDGRKRRRRASDYAWQTVSLVIPESGASQIGNSPTCRQCGLTLGMQVDSRTRFAVSRKHRAVRAGAGWFVFCLGLITVLIEPSAHLVLLDVALGIIAVGLSTIWLTYSGVRRTGSWHHPKLDAG
jgi:hypothetical protein